MPASRPTSPSGAQQPFCTQFQTRHRGSVVGCSPRICCEFRQNFMRKRQRKGNACKRVYVPGPASRKLAMYES
ncbi:hypothetical protein VTN49DRAFT_516 [Thermomyces lanuginosus]|uniref:uncharacterized protein n=1 Tax=Thermomyces lanuginosus TaxID=5541 RepID=UPI003743DDF1